MTSYDDEIELDFFQQPEPETLESPRRPRRRIAPARRRGGPRRPAPPPATVALARLAGLVALAILVVVGLVFWVGACGTKSGHSAYVSYVESLQPIAQSSAHVGGRLANELGSAKLTTAGLETKLAAWSKLEQEDYDAAQRLRPPGPLQTAHQQVLATLQLRAIALAGLEETLAGAGSKPADTVSGRLASQAQLLGASDIVWRELVKLPATQTLTKLGVTGAIVPPSQFVTNPDVVSERSFSIVLARLLPASAGGGGNGTVAGGQHGSALVGVAATAGGNSVTLSTSTAETVDDSADLAIQVTFADSGDYPEVQIPVTLTISASGKNVYTKTQTVRQITEQQQQVVSFGNIQLPPAAFANTDSLKVEVGKVPGETNLSNNTATYPVFFKLPLGG